MDSLFSFIAKFIGAMGRVGATAALGALVIYALRRAGREPFAALDGPTYQIIMSLGVIGFWALWSIFSSPSEMAFGGHGRSAPRNRTNRVFVVV
jgi:hypothetical protein